MFTGLMKNGLAFLVFIVHECMYMCHKKKAITKKCTNCKGRLIEHKIVII